MKKSTDTIALARPGNKLGTGVFDGLSACLASQYDFDFLWLSSFSLSASKGRPDMGLLSSTELYESIRDVLNTTNLPIVVDIDAGYGDLAYLHNFARDLIKMGVHGLCIEDNLLSKRSSLYEIADRKIADTSEHVLRVKVIRKLINEYNPNCMLIARTEALVARMGMDEALYRANAYKKAGADAIFVQSCDASGNEIKQFLAFWNKKTPVFITPTKYFRVPVKELFAAGASHVIYANQVIRGAFNAMKKILTLLQDGTPLEEIEEQICSIAEISETVGSDKMQEIGLEYDLIANENTY